MYKLLKDSLKIRRYLLVIILVIQFISVILSTLLPYMNGMFVDMLIDIKNVEEVIKYAITIAGVGIISLFLSYIYNLKIMKVKNNISFEINSRGILHLQKIPLEIEYEPTYMTQRLITDSRIVVDFFFDKIITATINLFVMFFLISLLFYLSKPIFGVTGVFILIYIFIYFLFIIFFRINCLRIFIHRSIFLRRNHLQSNCRRRNRHPRSRLCCLSYYQQS